MTKKKMFFLISRIVLTVILIILLYKFLDWPQIMTEVSTKMGCASFWVNLFFAVLASFGVFLFAGVNVWYLSTFFNQKVRRVSALVVVLKMFGASMFLPSRAGDLTMMYYLRKKGVGDSESVAIFLIDRLVYFLIICGLAVIGLLYFFYDLVSTSTLVLSIIGLLIATPVLIFVALKFSSWFFKKFFRQKVDALPFIKQFIKYPKQIVLSLLINSGRWCCRAFIFFWLFQAFGSHVPYFAIVLLISIELFITLAPVTIMGLGIREMFAVWAYPLLFSISENTTFLVYAFSLIIAYAEAIIICLVLGVEK